jgi:hypothetical protein
MCGAETSREPLCCACNDEDVRATERTLAELARMRAALSVLESEIEARAADLAAPKGGKRVPFCGDFAAAPPSVVSRLRWHVRNIRGVNETET